MSKNKFRVGDPVEWKPLVGDIKAGVVEAAIPPDSLPTIAQRKECDAHGATRAAVSYLVRVPSKTGRGKGRLFWPIAGALRPRDIGVSLAHQALKMVDGNLHVTSVLSLDKPESIDGFKQLQAVLMMAYSEGMRHGAVHPHAALQQLSRSAPARR